MWACSELASTARRSIQIWPDAVIAIRMLPLSLGSAVCAGGRRTSTPASFTKDAVTMKKINMMNTTSNIGVRSISAEVADALLLRRAIELASWIGISSTLGIQDRAQKLRGGCAGSKVWIRA